MGVAGDLPSAHGAGGGVKRGGDRAGATRRAAYSVEVAEVHVESFYFPSPVTRHKWQVPLVAVAQHPTGVNVRLTEVLDRRERRAPRWSAERRTGPDGRAAAARDGPWSASDCLAAPQSSEA